MADRFYLSLWFPSFSEEEMFPRLLAVVEQFPFSDNGRGFTHLAARALDWNQTIVLEQFFDVQTQPFTAIDLAAEITHDDYAYQFDTSWDLWLPAGDSASAKWVREPAPVQFLVHGTAFDSEIFHEHGHIMIELGLTEPFILEGIAVTASAKNPVMANVEQLVTFAHAVQKNSGITGRLLWSESESNIAQQLIQRLQPIQ